MNTHRSHINAYQNFDIAVMYRRLADTRFEICRITISTHPDGELVAVQHPVGLAYSTESEAKEAGAAMGQMTIDDFLLPKVIH
jgi:hypothetical protein